MKLRYKILGGIALLIGSGVAAMFSGVDVATGIISDQAKKYLRTISQFSVTFGELHGNPVVGYRLTDLRISLPKKGTVVSLKSAEAALTGRTFRDMKPALRINASGLRVVEKLLTPLTQAVQKAFPASPTPRKLLHCQ